MASVTTPAGVTSYAYDADGTQLIRRDPTSTTLYLPGEEITRDNTTGTLTGTRYYTHNGTVVALRVGGANISYLQADLHGSTQVSVKAESIDNHQVTRRTLDPYGNPLGTGIGVWPDQHGFLNKPHNPVTGLTDMGARTYDPTTGLFQSVDPLLDTANPLQWPAYTYAGNNPTTLSDPTGLLWDYDYEIGNEGSDPNHMTFPNGTTLDIDDGGVSIGGVPIPTDKHTPDPGVLAAKVDHHIAHSKLSKEYQSKINFWRETRGEYGGLTPYDIWDIVLEVCGWGDTRICSKEFIAKVNDLRLTNPQIGLYEGGGGPLPAARGGTGGRGAGGRPGASENPSESNIRAKCSFTGDTEVLMADGSHKPISEVSVDDQVFATDPEDGEHGQRAVLATQSHQDNVLDLVTDGGTITTTEDHRYWNATDKAWERADQLDSGDLLQTVSGQGVRVVGLRSSTAHPAPAYNLTIRDIHTYYVLIGNMPVLVHNDCPGGRLSDPLPRNLSKAHINAYEDIKAGRGAPQIDEMGQPKVFQGRRPHERFWAGSLEYRVPGAKNDEARILVKTLPSGRQVMGWTSDHYDTIRGFSAPHFSDFGW